MSAQLKRYLEAVIDLLKEGGDLAVVLKNLRAVMDKRGHSKMYPLLLRALLRVYPTIAGREEATLVIAKESDQALYKGEIKKDGKIVIDPSIVGGYILTRDFVRQDHSYKSKLLTWYQKATGAK